LTGKSLKDGTLVEGVIKAIKNLPGLEIASLISEDLERASSLMEDYDLDYEDALHLAVALRSKVKEIISNDGDFGHTSLRRKF